MEKHLGGPDLPVYSASSRDNQDLVSSEHKAVRILFLSRATMNVNCLAPEDIHTIIEALISSKDLISGVAAQVKESISIIPSNQTPSGDNGHNAGLTDNPENTNTMPEPNAQTHNCHQEDSLQAATQQEVN